MDDTGTSRPTSAQASRPQDRRHWVAAECLAAATVLVVCWLLFHNYLSVYLTFFGESPRETPESVRRYWLLVVVGALASAAMLASGLAHRRGWRWWAVVVTVLGACVALFPIEGAWPERPAEVPSERPFPAVECRSGGDSLDCPGG